MEKRTIKLAAKEFLADQSEIVFAYIFGSFVKGEKYRDIDIAIYGSDSFALTKIGFMQAELNKKTGKEVDIVDLHNLYKKKPAFAFNIVTSGKLLFNNDQEIHTIFKRKVLINYFDTAYLREKMDQAFKKRLETNSFGRRNYA